MSDAGSYDYSFLEESVTEQERLRLQAEVAQPLERQILEQHGLKPGMSVLDLGCGPGFVTRMIAQMVGTGQVLGADLNDDLLKMAFDSLAKQPLPNLSFQKANIYDLAALNQKFDFVYCRFLFQHLEQPMLALRQIQSVLKPGGTLLVLDVDDGWVSLYPDHENYELIFKMQQLYQKNLGGDRFIGRKLHAFFSDVGLGGIEAGVLTVTSQQLGMRHFLDLTTGYKVVFLKAGIHDISPDALKAMYAQCEEAPYLGVIGIFHVSGKRV